MNIGILGAGKVGISIAALLDVAGFVDSVILGDAQMVNNLDGLRKVSFRQLDVLAASELEDFVRDCDAIMSAAPFYLNQNNRQGVCSFRTVLL
jgi:saccharopine dehydrogenase-like NADP-dependent oxidoreductase